MSLLDSSGERFANLILLGVSAPPPPPDGVTRPEGVTSPAGVAKPEVPARGGVPALDSDASDTRRLAVRDLKGDRTSIRRRLCCGRGNKFGHMKYSGLLGTRQNGYSHTDKQIRAQTRKCKQKKKQAYRHKN